VNRATELKSIALASRETKIPCANIEYWLSQPHLLPSSSRQPGAGRKPLLRFEQEQQIVAEIAKDTKKGQPVRTKDVLRMAKECSGRDLGWGWFYGFCERMGGIRLRKPKIMKPFHTNNVDIVSDIKQYWCELDQWRKSGVEHCVSVDEIRALFERYTGKVVKLPDEQYAWVRSEGKTMKMASIVLSICDIAAHRFPPLFVFDGKGKRPAMFEFKYKKHEYQVDFTDSSWLNHFTYHAYLSKSIIPRLPSRCGIIHDSNDIHMHPLIRTLLSSSGTPFRVTPKKATSYCQANDTESVNEKFKCGFHTRMNELVREFRRSNPLTHIDAHQWREWYVEAGCWSYYEYVTDDDIRRAFRVTGVWIPSDGSGTDDVDVVVNNVRVSRPPFVFSSHSPLLRTVWNPSSPLPIPVLTASSTSLSPLSSSFSPNQPQFTTTNAAQQCVRQKPESKLQTSSHLLDRMSKKRPRKVKPPPLRLPSARPHRLSELGLNSMKTNQYFALQYGDDEDENEFQ
jgi:hypothetical protein